MTTIGITGLTLSVAKFLTHAFGVFIFVFIVYHLIIVPVVELLKNRDGNE